MKTAARLSPGDLVEVRTPLEILATLDDAGALGQMPFMPEMVEFCGKRFRVSKRAVKVCSSGSRSTMRGFRTDDVVLLDGLRCSGAAHDGCQKACMLFWREAWLRKAGEDSPHSPSDSDSSKLLARLKTFREHAQNGARPRHETLQGSSQFGGAGRALCASTGPNTYFCQASELLRATEDLTRRQRFGKCLSEVRAGNCTGLEMARRIAIWLFWRIRRRIFGVYARGTNRTTPMESLDLRPGEWVEIKPMESIIATLNAKAHNRGLFFSPDMRLECGKKHQVEKRLEKIIVDGTGQMRRLQNTVFLEGSRCGCAHVAFGGCSRCEFTYWREIWLRRVPGPVPPGS